MPRAKVERDLEWIKNRCIEDGDCWIWNAGTCIRGFPRFTERHGDSTRSVQGRRYVWELMSGMKAGPRQVTATCNNRRCMNPEHLKAISKSEVVRKVWADPAARARKTVAGFKGRDNERAKLDMDKARYIRASGETSTALAKEFDVSISLVSRVRLGKSWREMSASPFAGLGA